MVLFELLINRLFLYLEEETFQQSETTNDLSGLGGPFGNEKKVLECFHGVESSFVVTCKGSSKWDNDVPEDISGILLTFDKKTKKFVLLALDSPDYFSFKSIEILIDDLPDDDDLLVFGLDFIGGGNRGL
ncbi:hypothetical protein PGT21_002747 [Puccinia graminis f. sp. tritici]|uniref:Uncharacterized protein n=1 Tax=Puccinia graminis f. sp. tritici TaxID=56615 RepID=A0A5B0R1A9_PUCGR|nr:hypothetical protein PGT21_002747 [Puccinia graminis f. sp. tritici]